MTERNNFGSEEELEGRGTESEKSREFEEATHEAEAHVEETRGHEQAEIIEGMVGDLVEGSQEAIRQDKPSRVTGEELEEIKNPDEGDQATPINLPGTQKTSIASTDDQVSATPINTPYPVPPEELESSAEATPINTPYPVPPEAPTELPPQLSEEEIADLKLKSETGEVVDFKFFKPVPAVDENSNEENEDRSSEEGGVEHHDSWKGE